MANYSYVNATDIDTCSYGSNNVSLSIIVAIIYLSLGTAAFLSNIFIDYVIWQLGLHRIVGHFFILSLSLSDLIQGMFVGVINATELLANGHHLRFIQTQEWCRFSAGVSLLAIQSTVHNILIISIDRLLAILFPLRYHHIMSEKRAKILIACLWAFMVIWSALPLLGWSRKTNCLRPEHSICDWGMTLDSNYFLVTGTTVAFSVALVSLLQTVLLCVAFKQMKLTLAGNATSISRRNTVQRKVTRKVMYIVLTFCFTYLPWFTLVIHTLVTGLGGQSYIYACNSLIYINSFINPWIYAGTDRVIRKKMQRCILNICSNRIVPEMLKSTTTDPNHMMLGSLSQTSATQGMPMRNQCRS